MYMLPFGWRNLSYNCCRSQECLDAKGLEDISRRCWECDCLGKYNRGNQKLKIEFVVVCKKMEAERKLLKNGNTEEVVVLRWRGSNTPHS